MNNDERKGRPSASGFKQYFLCNGSFTLGKASPAEPPSPAATRGTRVHGALSGESDRKELTQDELLTVEQLAIQEEILLDMFIKDGWAVDSVVAEKRLWEEATESRWSGKADKIYILINTEKNTAGLIIDYKSTRYTDKSGDNLQLAALAALLDCDTSRGLDMCYVALVYPDGYDQALYDIDALETAADECKQLVDRITITHTQKRVPSLEACKWCKAKSICPEARGEVHKLVKVEPNAVSAQDLPRLLKASSIAEAVIKEIRAQAKRFMAQGNEVPGWELQPGHVRSTITDTEQVYNRAAVLGIDGKAFSRQVTISKKDLVGLCRDELKLKGNKLDETVAELVEGCTTDKMTSQSLREVKQ